MDRISFMQQHAHTTQIISIITLINYKTMTESDVITASLPQWLAVQAWQWLTIVNGHTQQWATNSYILQYIVRRQLLHSQKPTDQLAVMFAGKWAWLHIITHITLQPEPHGILYRTNSNRQLDSCGHWCTISNRCIYKQTAMFKAWQHVPCLQQPTSTGQWTYTIRPVTAAICFHRSMQDHNCSSVSVHTTNSADSK